VEKVTVCSEWGAENEEEAVLHGGIPAVGGGADEGLPQRVGFGRGVGSSAAFFIPVADAV